MNKSRRLREENERVEKQEMFLESLPQIKADIENEESVFKKVETIYNTTKKIPRSPQTYAATFELWDTYLNQIKQSSDIDEHARKLIGDILYESQPNPQKREEVKQTQASKYYTKRIGFLEKLVKYMREKEINKKESQKQQENEKYKQLEKKEKEKEEVDVKEIIKRIKANIEEEPTPRAHDALQMAAEYEAEAEEENNNKKTDYDGWKPWIESFKK